MTAVPKSPRDLAADLLTVAFARVIERERDEDADPHGQKVEPRSDALAVLEQLDPMVDWNGPPDPGVHRYDISDTHFVTIAPVHPDHELSVTGVILAALNNLDDDQTRRVLDYVVARYQPSPPPA